jgi:hypothetical protein
MKKYRIPAWPVVFCLLSALGVSQTRDATSTREPLAAREFWVAAGSAAGDGTPGRPFASLGMALARMRAANLPVATIHAGPGLYVEDLEIDRPLWIQGAGRRETRIAGAIRCGKVKRTIIQHLSIQAGENGIRLRGGILELLDVAVTGARHMAGRADSGVAVSVTAGGRLLLRQVTLAGNGGTALYISGPGTEAWADGLEVSDNAINDELKRKFILSTSYLPFCAAVEIGDRSRFYAENLRLRNNELNGLRVDSGAEAHVRHCILAATRTYDGKWGGFNASVAGGAVLEMHDFVSEQGAVGMLFYGAFGYLVKGDVRGNSIGIATRKPPAGFMLTCLLSPTVRVHDNDTAVDSDDLPVPEVNPSNRGSASCRRAAWKDYPGAVEK